MDAETLLKTASSTGRRLSLTELVIQALSSKIERGEYLPGQKIPTEPELCAEFGVSRTVIREAVASLKLGRNLLARHGVGVFVAETDQQVLADSGLITVVKVNNAMHALELRLALEAECAAYAAQRRTTKDLVTLKKAFTRMNQLELEDEDACARADFEFHFAIANSSGNPHFISILRSLGQEITHDLRLKHAQGTGSERKTYFKHIQREHGEILSAIEHEDPNAARRAMRKHLNESLDRYHALSNARVAQ